MRDYRALCIDLVEAAALGQAAEALPEIVAAITECLRGEDGDTDRSEASVHLSRVRQLEGEAVGLRRRIAEVEAERDELGRDLAALHARRHSEAVTMRGHATTYVPHAVADDKRHTTTAQGGGLGDQMEARRQADLAGAGDPDEARHVTEPAPTPDVAQPALQPEPTRECRACHRELPAAVYYPSVWTGSKQPVCRTCKQAQARALTTPCPECGKPMRRQSTRCRACMGKYHSARFAALAAAKHSTPAAVPPVVTPADAPVSPAPSSDAEQPTVQGVPVPQMVPQHPVQHGSGESTVVVRQTQSQRALRALEPFIRARVARGPIITRRDIEDWARDTGCTTRQVEAAVQAIEAAADGHDYSAARTMPVAGVANGAAVRLA